MITDQLLRPASIVVVGASNDVRKPGGKVLKNLMDHHFSGKLYVTNPKEETIQGVASVPGPADLPENVDLAILAIAARFIPETVEILARDKGTRAFIVLSAGFSEEGKKEGKKLEKELVAIVNRYQASLIGPNCIGGMTPDYAGVFTSPVPNLSYQGCDFISGSGATACFIMEAGIPKGLSFARVFSVGNSAQLGVEDLLAYMDETYEAGVSPRIKLLYIETLSQPEKLLFHARSLISKGCRIAAIKAGSSEAGSRAASSHTGALASPDSAVDALFRKAGIIRCSGRDELINVAGILLHKPLKGKNIGIITHAGGPAVMLTDALSEGGFAVPKITHPSAKSLLKSLFPGSSVGNPIDFLATGTPEQLALIIDHCDQQFNQLDGIVVIFGTTGLTPVYDAYRVIHEKMERASKPIYAILPSVRSAADEIRDFLSFGHVAFPDEVLFARALARTYQQPQFPTTSPSALPKAARAKIRRIIDQAGNGYLSPEHIQGLLDAAGIPRAGEAVVTSREQAMEAAEKLGFPVVMKVVGPVHKSDVGGVVLHVKNTETVAAEFDRMIAIPETTAILLQPMLSGIELFAGAKREKDFGHVILCGLGGIFIEVLKDVQSGLAPLPKPEALWMIRNLRGYRILKGARGQEGVNEQQFADVLVRLSLLVKAAPEIFEMDLNPLLGNKAGIRAVDARIRIEK